MNRPISSTLIASIALAACTPSPETPRETAEAPPASEASSTAASVVEELSIGVETGPEEYMLGRVVSLAVGPDGTIYASEAQPFRRSDGTDALVRAYDAEGEYLRAIGRVGQGPGEYEYPVLGVLPDGRPAIQDGELRRVSVYSTSGEFQHGFAANTGWSFLEIDREGYLYLQARPGGHSAPGLVLWKYSIDGELLETFPLPRQAPIPGEPYDFMLGLEGDIRPFTVMTVFAFSPEGYLVVGRNDRYRIDLQKPAGPVLLTRDVEPAAVLPEERAEWNAFRDAYVQRVTASQPGAEVVTIPDEKPFFRELYAGQEGRIWAHRHVEAVKRDDVEPIPSRPERPLLTWREPPTYDVFESDGTFVGTAVLPEGFDPRVFRGPQVWGTRTDEAGVTQIVRLRVVLER